MKFFAQMIIAFVILIGIRETSLSDDPGIINTTYSLEAFLSLPPSMQENRCKNAAHVVGLLQNGSWRKSCELPSAQVFSHCVFGRHLSQTWECYCYLTASCREENNRSLKLNEKKRIDNCKRDDIANCKGRLKCRDKGKGC